MFASTSYATLASILSYLLILFRPVQGLPFTVQEDPRETRPHCQRSQEEGLRRGCVPGGAHSPCLMELHVHSAIRMPAMGEGDNAMMHSSFVAAKCPVLN